MSNALSVAQDYVRTFNAGDAAAMEGLFAERATLRHPVGFFAGRPAIMAFYRDRVFGRQANLVVLAALVEGAVCILELEGRLLAESSERVARIRDVLRVDTQGLITDLAVWIG